MRRIKAWPTVMHRKMRSAIGPVHLGAERSGGIPLDISEQLPDDLFGDVQLGGGVGYFGKVSGNCGSAAAKFPLTPS